MLLDKTDPLGKDTVLTYDDAGHLLFAKDRNNQTITYTYTPTDQIDTITYPDTSTVKFTYDPDDRLKNVTDPIGVTSYAYDDAKRLTSYTNAFGLNVSYTYDLAGNVTKITYPGNKAVNYTYDALNRLKSVTNWLSQTATYSYDDAGRLISLTNFNGSVAAYTYDAANRMTSLQNTASDAQTIISSYSYTLDASGNKTNVSQAEPIATVIPTDTINFTYNALKDRLLSAGSTNFTYDFEGQLATGGALSYTFDYEHRLKTVIASPQGEAISFVYDGKGNRLQATRNGVVTRYIYDASGNLLAETDSSNTITRYYIYGHGLLAMVTPANQVYTYHYNGIGSTVAITDSGNNVVNKYSYTPFGEVSNQVESITQPFKFNGKYGVMYEPDGLCYMRARYYDPHIHRFISEDPSGFNGGINQYAYCGDDPVNYIDPFGIASIRARPLGLPLGAVATAAYGKGNIAVEHWQIFYNDGSNNGYLGNGTNNQPRFGSDVPSNLNTYDNVIYNNLPDNLLQQAEKNVQAQWNAEGRQYDYPANDCQSYVINVLKESNSIQQQFNYSISSRTNTNK